MIALEESPVGATVHLQEATAVIIMRVPRVIIAVWLCSSLIMAQQYKGTYSRLATPIWGNSAHRFTIKSPNGRKSIMVRDNLDTNSDEIRKVSFKVNGKEYKSNIGYLVNSEVEWAPDSKAFFVTYSDGGNVGTYHVKIFYVGSSGFRTIEPVRNGRRLFAPACDQPETPNIGAIQWMKDSSRLLLALEVPPHSSCVSMGTFRIFEISVPSGRVLKRYGQLRAKHVFAGIIGEELVNADDECVPQLHEKIALFKMRERATCVPTGVRIGPSRRK